MKQRILPARIFKCLSSLLLVLILLGTNACLYTNVRLPLDRDVDETTFGSREGTASSQSMLFLFAWGDSSTRAAAEAGGLTTVTHLDMEQQVFFFGLYTKTTTIAYGN